ncbi:hypothetical protein DAPPUDRAFT_248809 [Daphnia pulex]|uniref:Uncharacterized protein n=1 Tax=Daphnia pulex TaxID=6669 RepID=E9GVA0_DAPPU|nr:hypothetical protein DAPPUDRAFT_248809 [Daphnia pulex]|eukprot:EFX76623.1 hypothetical protein DAPPUDRAFT_248809 [Daphnia pulex]
MEGGISRCDIKKKEDGRHHQSSSTPPTVSCQSWSDREQMGKSWIKSTKNSKQTTSATREYSFISIPENTTVSPQNPTYQFFFLILLHVPYSYRSAFHPSFPSPSQLMTLMPRIKPTPGVAFKEGGYVMPRGAN